MRSPFNTDCDLYSGPGSIPPNQFLGTFICRLVYQDGIQDYEFGGLAPKISYWLTIQEAIPQGMFTYPNYSLDTSIGDRVAVPSGTEPRFAVLYTDFIVWKNQDKYYRAYLLSLPLPNFLQGGVVLGGSAIMSPPTPPAPSGGVVLGGSAIMSPPTPPAPSGGVVLGGSAIMSPPTPPAPSGGVVLGGSASLSPPHAGVSGGVVLGGSAIYSPPTSGGPSGGVLLGGSAIYSPPTSGGPSGGVVLGGAGVYSFSPGFDGPGLTCPAAGNLVLGHTYSYTNPGGIDHWWKFTPTSSGAYHLVRVNTGSDMFYGAYQPCGSFLASWGFNTGCTDLMLTAGTTYYLDMFDMGPSSDYSITMLSGPC